MAYKTSDGFAEVEKLGKLAAYVEVAALSFNMPFQQAFVGAGTGARHVEAIVNGTRLNIYPHDSLEAVRRQVLQIAIDAGNPFAAQALQRMEAGKDD